MLPAPKNGYTDLVADFSPRISSMENIDTLKAISLSMIVITVGMQTTLYRVSVGETWTMCLVHFRRALLFSGAGAGIFVAHQWLPVWFLVLFTNLCYLLAALSVLVAVRWRFGSRRSLLRHRAIIGIVVTALSLVLIMYFWLDDVFYFLTMIMSSALLLIVGLAIQTFYIHGAQLHEGDQLIFAGICLLVLAVIAGATVSVIFGGWILFFSVALSLQMLAVLILYSGVLLSLPHWLQDS